MDFYNLIQHYITKSSIALQPHRELVGQIAAGLSILQVLSPLFMFNSMRKAKSTLGMPFMPFLLITVLTSLNIRFAQMLNDDATFNANIVGFSMMLVYIPIYLHYATPQEKRTHLMEIFGVAVFIALAITYSKFEDPEKVKTRFGLILSAIMYCFFTLPIFGIYEAFKSKCTRHMPFAMIVSGTLVGFSWLLHGIIINSGFIIGQNLFMVFVNAFQLLLFLIYPSEPASESSEKISSKKNKNE